MRILYRIVIAGAFALAIGSSGGLLLDETKSIVAEDASQTTFPPIIQMVDESADLPTKSDEAFKAREVACLTEIMFREGQNQSVGVRQLIAMVSIARRDDSDQQWPKTICGIMLQKGQISGIDKDIRLNRNQLLVLDQTHRIASEIYDSAWRTQLLPRGWECVRYWKLSDKKLASLGTIQFAQLGISKAMSGLNFFNKLEAVPSPPGDVTFYRDPNRCKTTLPTTI